MASPTLTLINAGGLTDGVLSDADTNTGWNDLTTADTDIKVEGTASMSGIFRADGEQGYYDSGGAPVTAVGKVLRGWILTNNLPYMGTEASDPFKLLAFDGTTTELKTLFGSDTYPGGWFYFWQDMDDFTTLTLANVDRWGVESGHASNAKNVVNTWMDVLRYMDGYYLTGGTSGDKVTFETLAATDKTSAYGIVQNQFNVFFCTGTIQIGNGATTTYFESDGQVIVFLDMPGGLSISAGLYDISATGSGCDCVIKSSVLRANGTDATTRFVLDFSDTNHVLTFTDNLVNRAGTCTFASGQTVTGNTFDDCGQVTHGGADMDGSAIKNYEGTADSSALIYNVNADPDGEMDNMSFTKGTTATHAIEFGTNVPSSMTLRGIDFSGYNAADDANDSTFNFLDTSGTITLNLVGCSGNVSVKAPVGLTVNVVNDPVTVTGKTVDVAGNDVENARVHLEATTGGYLPVDVTVTIVNSGTTATVTHTGHGLLDNDKVVIRDASLDENNGVFQISVTGANTYTYTMGSAPGSSPTGTIKSTFVALNGLTSASGEISISRVFTSNQPLTGRARKSSAGDDPIYKNTVMTGTVNSATGATITGVMIED